MITRLFAFALFTALCSTGALISYNSTPGATNSVPGATTGSLLFPGFDPSLGTLNSLALAITASEGTSFQYTDAVLPPSRTFELFAGVNASVILQVGASPTGFGNTQAQDLGQRFIAPNNHGPFTAQTNPVAVTGNASFSDPATLASFTSAGGTIPVPYTLLVSAVSTSPETSPIPTPFPVTGQISGTVTYNYTAASAVPEPGTLAPVLAGALFFAVLLLRPTSAVER